MFKCEEFFDLFIMNTFVITGSIAVDDLNAVGFIVKVNELGRFVGRILELHDEAVEGGDRAFSGSVWGCACWARDMSGIAMTIASQAAPFYTCRLHRYIRQFIPRFTGSWPWLIMPRWCMLILLASSRNRLLAFIGASIIASAIRCHTIGTTLTSFPGIWADLILPSISSKSGTW